MATNQGAMGQINSYLICATPRTGSTLLCSLLKSTAVAGYPESYFREPDELSWADRWEIPRSPDGVIDFAGYLRATRDAGSTDNKVFAARIMWGGMDYVVDKLGVLHPELAGADLDLLHRAFGDTRFVYLQRENVLAQAVSWFRAEQTGVWHETGQSKSDSGEQAAQFDFDGINELVHVIGEHNKAWRRWFTTIGIQPYPVRYEDLDSDPIGTTLDILDFLNLDLPSNRTINARNIRLADELSAQWMDQYRVAAFES